MNRSIFIFLSFLLAACATPQVDQSAADFEQNKYQADLNECRGGTIVEASAVTIGTAAFGSLMGVVHGLPAGALAGDSAEGVVIGAAVGGVLGFGYGATKALKEHEGDIAGCLRGKGYELLG